MEKPHTVYVPGDLTEPKYRHPSHYDLVHKKFQQQIENNKLNGYPKHKEDFSAPVCDNKQLDLKSEVDEMMRQQKVMKKFSHTTRKEKEKDESPYKAVASNFILAKKLAKENLEHEPLPDTIADAMYRKRQMHGDLTPGLILKDGNYATGVGYKGYPGYGATRCTKMKIFRPKTCIPKISKDNSVSSFDKKWRFVRQQKVSPIDLAICWDMTPINPGDEPKRTTHIDGSNGSQAPAVFSLVHTPKDDVKNIVDEDECETRTHKQHREKCEECSSKSSNSSSQHNLKRAKSAFNVEENSESSHQSSKINNKLHQSTPDLTDSGSHKYCSRECYKERNINRRLCVACEMKNVKLKERPKSEYKMAFKAGVPNNKTVSSKHTPMYLKVPKQREPYRRKNYAITSLAPPFSLQREKSQDYPDHWRLATVYQHSYKPLHLRKKPLLMSVFQ